MGLKMSEILLIMAALLLLFGATRLPQLGSSLGQAIRNFKKGFNDPDAASEETKAPGSLSSTTVADKDLGAQKAPGHRG